MIVRVTFKQDHVMLFGDSYKPWKDQFMEYAALHKATLPTRPLKVQVSKSAWKSWGGLKWCSHEDFQHQLNREGCQSADADNPNPRLYVQMEFKVNLKVWGKVQEIMVQVKGVA